MKRSYLILLSIAIFFVTYFMMGFVVGMIYGVVGIAKGFTLEQTNLMINPVLTLFLCFAGAVCITIILWRKLR